MDLTTHYIFNIYHNISFKVIIEDLQSCILMVYDQSMVHI